jgi:hypothetical protein
MTDENNGAEFRHEGQPAFATDTENENSESSQDENNESDGTSTEEEEDKKPQDSEKKPLNEHPRWAEREQEWNDKFSKQEAQHKADMEALRSEFGTVRKENTEKTQIPPWFGGSQEQWDAYRADRDAELKAAEERAAERINSARTAEEKAVEEATAYMQSEMTAIQTDKALNPTGAKIDPNRLLKIVIDNDLVDSQGRWNYRAGIRIYNSTRQAPKTSERKELAAATNSEAKAESKPPAYKTSADFKKSRPW